MKIAGIARTVTLLVLLSLACSPAWGGPAPVKAAAKDKCPVCGMFVAKYPDFAAQIRFKDGSALHFDGAKDMFTCYLNLQRYAPGRKASDVAAVYVTNYYDLAPIDAARAYFVTGSDVYGPMGRELVPFVKEEQAREFMKDHRGKGLFRFDQVTPPVLRTLE